MTVRGCGGRAAEKLVWSELYTPPLPRGVEGRETESAGVGEGEMTRPITVMEWLCYSWLHTAVCSHSHSPPVQRNAAFQTHICRVCLSRKIIPHPYENIKTLHSKQNKRHRERNRNTTALYMYTVILDPARTERSAFKLHHTQTQIHAQSPYKHLQTEAIFTH